MISPPISRVDTPQDVVQAYSRCPFSILELDLLGLRKVLAEEVRRAGLQRFAILHHRFDAVGADRAGESLAGGLLTFDDRHRHVVLGEVGVDVEHLPRLFARLGSRWHGRCALPATGTRSCAGTSASAVPSGRRWPIG